MRRGIIPRSLHRVHRWSGALMALLMGVWFASGAVMTFADYPAYTQTERLVNAEPLTAAISSLPPALEPWLQAGKPARLSMLEGEARWLLRAGDTYRALRSAPPWDVTLLDAYRARAAIERAYGPCAGDATEVTRPDQWTVGHSAAGSYPLWHVDCRDAASRELYVSSRSGEIVQESTRAERLLAWLGPIPHWIYPAVLRRDRALWRTGVLWLSALGLVVTLSGVLAGIHAAVRRKRGVAQQRYLRWHQRLGLGFGVFASAWVFSGALSLEPFYWSSPAIDPAAELLHVQPRAALAAAVASALDHCRAQLPGLRELELRALGGLYAVCSDQRGQTRVVDLDEPALAARPRLTDARLSALARSLHAQLALSHAPDDYYYPTHRQPIALPYAKLSLRDAARTALYIDPARAQLVAQLDARTRLERWLYHALHSWDLPVLYRHRALWRTLVIAAMALGTALACLGAAIVLRRQRLRRSTRAQPKRTASRT